MSFQLPEEPEWVWPLDLTAYDRSGDLTAAEVVELDRILCHSKIWRSSRFENSSELSRLSLPILDALALIEADLPIRSGVMKLVCREMQRRQKAIWGWTHDEWVEILSDTYTFHRRHGVLTICRQCLLAVSYLLRCFKNVSALGSFNRRRLASKVFGTARVDAALEAVTTTLTGWGYHKLNTFFEFRSAMCEALLANQSPRLRDLKLDVLSAIRHPNSPRRLRGGVLALSRALHGLGMTETELDPHYVKQAKGGDATAGVAPEWVCFAQRWRDTTTLQPRTGVHYRGLILKAGRWATRVHPEAVAPGAWTREIAAEFVAVVCRLTVGQWTETKIKHPHWGKPLSAPAKVHHLSALAAFFRDCQEWEWIPRRFDPTRCFAAPRSLLGLLGSNPRVLADDVWAKLLWAGLNLTEADLRTTGTGTYIYPIVLVRAVTIVWLFCGLRRDEIRRLQVGSVRRQDQATQEPGQAAKPRRGVCMLMVPVNKTCAEFTKPVDTVVGDAVSAWERVRPEQPVALDEKTGEMIHYLFCFRARRISKNYINGGLIPVLCRKAGVPPEDARGNITSHRARSTIASQLYNAEEPMSLFELQQWLGHRTLTSTQHYAKINPKKLAKAYEDTSYFKRNLRTIEVLIDREVVMSGAAAHEPWKFYDLGHGYCTYDFFDECEHRMACARCAFYRPKGSTEAQLLEGKSNLLRMRQEIPLTEGERAAVDEGLSAMEKLLARLADVPTPAGLTPRQLKTCGLIQLQAPTVPPERGEQADGACLG